MFATTSTSAPVVWQGNTQDGHTIRLTRSGLAKILSNLHQTGLNRLIQGNLNGNREAAVIRAIAKVVSLATRSSSGQKSQGFTAIGKTRTYEIVTQPINGQQSVIRLVRSRPNQEFEYEGEFEYESEGESEGEYFIGKALKNRKLKRQRKKGAATLAEIVQKGRQERKRQEEQVLTPQQMAKIRRQLQAQQSPQRPVPQRHSPVQSTRIPTLQRPPSPLILATQGPPSPLIPTLQRPPSPLILATQGPLQEFEYEGEFEYESEGESEYEGEYGLPPLLPTSSSTSTPQPYRGNLKIGRHPQPEQVLTPKQAAQIRRQMQIERSNRAIPPQRPAPQGPLPHPPPARRTTSLSPAARHKQLVARLRLGR